MKSAQLSRAEGAGRLPSMMGRSPPLRDSWGIFPFFYFFFKTKSSGWWPSFIMTLTSCSSTLELSIIPSLVFYLNALGFSVEHKPFPCWRIPLPEAQGCPMMRWWPRLSGASENLTGNRDRSAKAALHFPAPKSAHGPIQHRDSLRHKDAPVPLCSGHGSTPRA